MASKIGRRDSQWSLRWALSKARKLIYLETPLFETTASEDNAHQVDLIKVITERLQQAPDLKVIIAVPKRIPFGAGYESFAQRFYIARNQAIASLQSAAPKRIVAYQPIGFPGRPEVIRGTLAVVDDVWSLVGSSSFSRRGLTFDGSIDIALIDKTITSGISRNIRLIRKQAMARTLNLAPPIGTETANANWVRLSHPVKAFQLIQEILDRGGDGFIEPVWPGLSESELPALDRRIADPEGRDFSAAIGIFTDVLSGLGQSRV
jgi:phosphatidylserine/phosphatidylglycerophosphate/cardiolipin synthase-like enzyme